MRDVMQSRDDVALQQTQSAGVADKNNSAYAALQERYVEGLRWALLAHQRVCEQSGGASSGNTELASLPFSAGDPSVVAWKAQVQQGRMECLQGLVDAAFELFVSAPDPANRGAALDAAAPAVTRLCAALAGTASHAPALYYHFKYLDFRADYFEQLGQRDLELDYLTQALAAWRRIEKMGHFGAGNKVSDPNKEVAGILARMARVECADGVKLHDTLQPSGLGKDSANVNGVRDAEGEREIPCRRAQERGLVHIQQSLNYTAAAWLAPELSAYFAAAVKEEELRAVPRKFGVTVLSGVAGRVLHLLVEGCYTALLCLRPLGAVSPSSESTGNVHRGSGDVVASGEGSHRAPGTSSRDEDSHRAPAGTSSRDEPECGKRSQLHSLYVRLVAQLCTVLQEREETCSAVLLAEIAALQQSFRCVLPVSAHRLHDARTRVSLAQPQPAESHTQTQTGKVYKRLKRKQRPLQ
jgi:hypothetical protein